MKQKQALKGWLDWYQRMGIDVAVTTQPVNRLQAYPPSKEPLQELSPLPSFSSSHLFLRETPMLPPTSTPTEHCESLPALRAVLENFEGCDLKRTATHLVFGDGNTHARVMLVGEAPGAEEDRQGIPFVGLSGQLLDRMLAAIGLDRTKVYITNIVPWRPPGNRQPTTAEIATCQPFIERHIELIAPDILVLVGGVSAKTLLATNEGIMKVRGRWRSYQTAGLRKPIDAIATFHPAFLLRSPAQKALAWRDLLMIDSKLKELSTAQTLTL